MQNLMIHVHQWTTEISQGLYTYILHDLIDLSFVKMIIFLTHVYIYNYDVSQMYKKNQPQQKILQHKQISK